MVFTLRKILPFLFVFLFLFLFACERDNDGSGINNTLSVNIKEYSVVSKDKELYLEMKVSLKNLSDVGLLKAVSFKCNVVTKVEKEYSILFYKTDLDLLPGQETEETLLSVGHIPCTITTNGSNTLYDGYGIEYIDEMVESVRLVEDSVWSVFKSN